MRRAGGTWFFTICLENRASGPLVREIDMFRAAYLATARERPFRTGALVVLPDHLHCVWTLPPGDTDFGVRWGAIKSRFTRGVKGRMGLNPILRPSQRRKGDAGIWRRRFWEHLIRDDDDLARHMEYCWINPAKHGLVARVRDWEFSTCPREVRRGVVPADWGGDFAEGRFGEAVRVRQDGVSPDRDGPSPASRARRWREGMGWNPILRAWPFSTFHREVGRGTVPAAWAGEFAEGGFGEAVRVR